MGKNFSRFAKKKIADLLPENTATRRITTAINICQTEHPVFIYPEFAEETEDN